MAHNTLRCAAPLSGVARTVSLRLGLREDYFGAWSQASVPFTFYDSDLPPEVNRISRSYGPLDAGEAGDEDPFRALVGWRGSSALYSSISWLQRASSPPP